MRRVFRRHKGQLTKAVKSVLTLNWSRSTFPSAPLFSAIADARAFGRIGTSYVKLGDYTKAIEYFQRSLTEHRTPEVLTKLRDAEKTKAENDRLAYIDQGKADEAREEGNTLFKKGDFPAAVKAYTEAIKRAPEDPRGYANRAAAYIKLASFPDAIKVDTPSVSESDI